MTPKSHARLLGIFAWIYAGWLGVNLIAAAISFAIFFNDLPDHFRLPTLDEFIKSFSEPYGAYSAMLVVGVAAICLAVALMLAALIANVRLGRKLRGPHLPTKRSLIFSSVLTLITSTFGGLITLPFGLLLFGYAIWFAVSSNGLANLENEEPANPQL